MEINRDELKTEHLPHVAKRDLINILIEQIETDEHLSRNEVNEKLELILIERTTCTCNRNRIGSSSTGSHRTTTTSTTNSKQLLKPKVKCTCHSAQNRFILGQFYFDSRKYIKAYEVFDAIKDESYAALFQLGVILYDDLLNKDEGLPNEEKMGENVEIDTKTAFTHPNKEFWQYGFECMLKVAKAFNKEQAKDLIYLAQYNVGKAYFQGFGVKQSDDEAEKWWLLAADNGNPNASVSAMTALAFFYSRKNDREYFDLSKAFLWHNEACGNGSLESQGALGAMYYFGLGCKKNMEAAYECLTHSSERGNVYSMGLLSDYYYRNKFFVKAYELSKKVSLLYDVDKISKETNCTRTYVAKGIALACFIQARCLDLGKGTPVDNDLAKRFYKRSYKFDPDLCQLFQNQTTHEKI